MPRAYPITHTAHRAVAPRPPHEKGIEWIENWQNVVEMARCTDYDCQVVIRCYCVSTTEKDSGNSRFKSSGESLPSLNRRNKNDD